MESVEVGGVSAPHALELSLLRLHNPCLSVALPTPVLWTLSEGNKLLQPLIPENSAISGMITFDPKASADRGVEVFCGNTYLGERLRCLVVLSNTSNFQVKNVSVKAYIKSKRLNKAMLLDTDELIAAELKDLDEDPLRSFTRSKVSGFSLSPNQTREYVLTHLVSDLGPHRLGVTVTYELEANNVGYRFEKVLRMEALKALKLTATLHKVSGTQSMWIAELEVRNVSAEQVFIEVVNFNAQQKFIAKNMNEIPRSPLLAVEKMLMANEIQYFLFQVTANEFFFDDLVESFDVGRFEISWRRENCEKGQIVTQQLRSSLERSAVGAEIRVAAISNPIVLEKTFKVTFEVYNACAVDLRIRISILRSKSASIVVHGLGSLDIGVLKPRTRKPIVLEFMALTIGLHFLPNISLETCQISTGETRSHTIEGLQEVFVTDKDQSFSWAAES